MTPELQEHLERHLSWPDLNRADRTRFLTLALCGEIGELATVLPECLGREEFVKELADVGNYMAMLAVHLDVELRGSTGYGWDIRIGGELTHGIALLCGSAGKLANVLKKSWRGDSEPPGTNRADEFIAYLRRSYGCLCSLTRYLDLDLDAIMLAKLMEVERRPSWQEAHFRYQVWFIPTELGKTSFGWVLKAVGRPVSEEDAALTAYEWSCDGRTPDQEAYFRYQALPLVDA